MENKNNSTGWIYCFKRENSAVFLDRKDNVIKEFNTYDEAIAFADENIHLIDEDH